MTEKILEELEKRLNAKTIHDLRQVARVVGVPRPADGKKERILRCIMQIASGEVDPAAPAVRGAHPKSPEYDRQMVADILRCREICLTGSCEADAVDFSVAGGADFDPLDFIAEGVLGKSGGKWVMHINGCRDSLLSEIFVSDYFVNSFKLREGDLLKGNCRRSSLDEIPGLDYISAVNGSIPELVIERKDIDRLLPVYPDRKLPLSEDGVTNRIISLLSPLGAGQRAFVTGAHGSGKTAVLKEIACGLKTDGDIKLIAALIDARPEESADFRRAFPCTDVFVSLFDAGAAGHVKTARLALEYAKRQAEKFGAAVLVLDDLTKLAKAYEQLGRQTTAPFGPTAADSVKSYLASAKNTAEGVSLTILSALSDSGDETEEVVYSALKGVCNMRVALSSKLARMRIYPPVDTENTYAFGDDKLLSETELKAADVLRNEGIEKIIDLVGSTKNNEELCKLILN